MKKALLAIFSVAIFSGCAALGPSVIKTYHDTRDRSQIAILRADKSKNVSIDGCDGVFIGRGAKYILLDPGRHEILFSISGQTLFVYYSMRNKKYLDAEAGHTYILKTTLGKLFDVGDKWFPEVLDVTDDPQLHVNFLPREENIK